MSSDCTTTILTVSQESIPLAHALLRVARGSEGPLHALIGLEMAKRILLGECREGLTAARYVELLGLLDEFYRASDAADAETGKASA